MTFRDAACMNTQDIEQKLQTSIQKGLATDAVAARQKEFGKNEISVHTISIWQLLLRQVTSPFMYLLAGVGTLSFCVGEFVNGYLIGIIIIVNTIIGFYQEYKAEKTVELLRSYVRSKVHVRRNDTTVIIDTIELVPGDIVILAMGSKIPADIRLTTASNLAVNESVLTGESAPVDKQVESLSTPPTGPDAASNCVFSGTYIARGEGEGIVIAIGNATEFGTLAGFANGASRTSGYSTMIGTISTFLIRLILITMAALLVGHLIVHGTENILTTIFFLLAIAVSTAPETLPVVITFALSRGALILAKRNVIVKRLSAIEDLGSITVLCTDKTGTITFNNLHVVDSYSYNNENPRFIGAIGTHAGVADAPRSFENALFESVEVAEQAQLATWQIATIIPFDPETRVSGVTATNNGDTITVLRGAMENVFEQCTVSESDQKNMREWAHEQGLKGHRVLAIAFKKSESAPLVCAGLVAFDDPLKPSARGALKRAHHLGISVKIITGDSPDVAGAVAYTVGLTQDRSAVISGTDFEALSEAERITAADTYHVFARVAPAQKHLIITTLQQSHTVGYMGEGINDIPALQAANVGIVVDTSTDIAQEAADIIVMDHSLSAIVEGIEIGRTVFGNTSKYLLITLSSNFGNLISVAIASLMIPFLPMAPLQILLVNMLSDLNMVSLASDSVDVETLQHPSRYRLGYLARTSAIFGIISVLFDLIVFKLYAPRGPNVLQTVWFTTSLFTELSLIYALRTRKPFFKAAAPSWLLTGLSLIIGIITLAVPYTSWGNNYFKLYPLDTSELMFVLMLVIGYFAVTECVKLLYNGMIRRKWIAS